MSLYNWNPVFNKVVEIKNKFIEQFDYIDYSIVEDKTCLEIWIEKLKIQEYIDLFKYIQVNQKDTMLLIRYASYSDVYGGESEMTDEVFWKTYDGFYTECRSVVIDINKEIIVLCPFKKFFNVGQHDENSIENITKEIKNAKSVEITDKLDGSMQSARYVSEYGKIIMAGSQAIDMDNSWRLKDGYDILISNQNYVDMISAFENFTFIFEYISLKDSHVVCYTEEQEGLYLIGMRNALTSELLSYAEVIKIANEFSAKTTVVFNKTFDEVLKDTKIYKSNEKEGYVINIDGKLVKIKVDDYLEIHKVLSKISSINLIIKAIADNTYDDLLAKIPNAYKNRVEKVAKIVCTYVKTMEKTVQGFYDLAPKYNKKEFMIWVNERVPKKYLRYVVNLYYGYDNNYLKSNNEKAPKYIKLNEITGDNNYNEIFNEE